MADDYAAGATVKARVVEWIGRQEYVARDGQPKRAGMYKVDVGNGPQTFRFGIKNEKLAATKFRVGSYEELVKTTLVLEVRHFPMGANGFVLKDILGLQGNLHNK